MTDQNGQIEPSKDMPVQNFCEAVREIVGPNVAIRANISNTQLVEHTANETRYHVDILSPSNGISYAFGDSPEAVIEQLKEMYQ